MSVCALINGLVCVESHAQDMISDTSTLVKLFTMSIESGTTLYQYSGGFSAHEIHTR